MTPEHWDDYVASLECLTASDARRRFRQTIKEAWGHRCAYCGCQRPADLTLDHIRPRMRGGPSRRSNLVPACRGCNQDKGTADWRNWFRLQSFYCEMRERCILLWIQRSWEQGTALLMGLAATPEMELAVVRSP